MQQPRKSRGSVIWKFLGAIVFTLLLAGAAGLTYEQWSGARERGRFPAPGKLFPVGTHSLHLHCEGSGAPTVLLESGWGMPSAVWARTVPLLAARTRTCVYDRAGYGWSEAGPAPRDAAHIAAEAEALLDAAGVEGTLILVGHSFGGLCARLLAHRIPGRVQGVVLVDAVQEDMLRTLPMIRQRMEERRAMLEAAPYLAEIGLFRLAPGAFGIQERGEEFAALSDAQWELLRTFRATPKQVGGALQELLLFEQSMEQARGAGNLGTLPLKVLSAGKQTKPRWVPPDYSDAEYFERWNGLQEKLRHLSEPPAERQIAENSGHEIPIQQPEIILAAVEGLLRNTRPAQP
jgi:pimeloyl-ACP methyl ester carboxylesterase